MYLKLVLLNYIKLAADQSTAEPEFGTTMDNVTVIKGRDASFTCVVLNLGPHRVSPADLHALA